VWIVVGLAVAGGIGFGVWYWLKRRREGGAEPPEPPEAPTEIQPPSASR
jgi:uncharacterized iron-regulated membrane protein